MAIRKSGEHVSSNSATEPVSKDNPQFANEAGPVLIPNMKPVQEPELPPGCKWQSSGTAAETEPILEELEPELLDPGDTRPKFARKIVISISDELKEHYDTIIATRDKVVSDPDETGGAKAAILNATSAALRDLAKLQLDLYNSDTIARLRQAIFNALEEASPALKTKVLTLLEQHLEEVEP